MTEDLPGVVLFEKLPYRVRREGPGADPIIDVLVRTEELDEVDEGVYMQVEEWQPLVPRYGASTSWDRLARELYRAAVVFSDVELWPHQTREQESVSEATRAAAEQGDVSVSLNLPEEPTSAPAERPLHTVDAPIALTVFWSTHTNSWEASWFMAPDVIDTLTNGYADNAAALYDLSERMKAEVTERLASPFQPTPTLEQWKDALHAAFDVRPLDDLAGLCSRAGRLAVARSTYTPGVLLSLISQLHVDGNLFLGAHKTFEADGCFLCHAAQDVLRHRAGDVDLVLALWRHLTGVGAGRFDLGQPTA